MEVPIYDTPEVSQTPTPGARVGYSTANGFEAIGEGLQRLGAGAERLDEGMQEAKRKADTVATTNALSSLQDYVDDRLTNHQTGILAAQGQNAFAAANGYQGDWQKKAQQIRAGLANPEQQQYFDQHSAQLLRAAGERVELHLAQQQDVAAKAAVENTFGRGLKAVANATDAPINTAIEQRHRLAGVMRNLGHSEDEVQATLGQFDQQAAQAILQKQLLAGNADAATKLLDAPYAPGPDGKMQTLRQALGAAAPPFERQVASLNTAVQSDQKTTEITASSHLKGPDGTVYRWIDALAARAKVDAMPATTPEELRLKDETRARVEHEITVNQREKEQLGQQLLDQAKTIYAQSKNPNDPRLAPIRTQMLDPQNNFGGQWTHFTNEIETQRRSSRFADAEARRQQAEFDKTIVAKFGAQSTQDQANADIDGFSQGQASDWAKAKMQQLKNAATRELRKDGGLSAEQMRSDVSAIAEKLKFDKPTKEQFLSSMTDWWFAQRGSDGDKVVDQKLIDQQIQYELTKGDTGHWWSRNRYRFQFQPSETFRRAADEDQLDMVRAAPAGPTATGVPTLPTVPPAARTAITASFAKQGIAQPTEQQIQTAYAKARAKGYFQ